MRARPSFTLIEMVIVILILGVMTALLMPALTGAKRQTDVASMRAEIEALANALAQFHITFGTYPPSAIVLKEDWYDMSVTAQARSATLLRRLWPRLTVSTNSGSPHNWNINGNADLTETLNLNGIECLVFFLGGMPEATTMVGQGFSRLPTDPFDRTNTTVGRVGPFFEFNAGQLIDNDSDAMPEMQDGLGTQFSSGDYVSYAYFSAYGGMGQSVASNVTTGYCPPDMSGGSATTTFWYDSSGSVSVSSTGPNPYTLNAPSGAGAAAVFWNAQTFQIISAGMDGDFGGGGQYDPNTPNDLPQADRDNLTNFAGSELYKGS